MQANGFGDKYNYKYQFTLVESKDINAWCMPGGKVAIYSGILPVTQNEAGLATVTGHEIAHAIAQHAAERYSQMTLAQAGGGILGANWWSITRYQKCNWSAIWYWWPARITKIFT